MVLPSEEAIPAIAPIGSERAGMQSFSSMPSDYLGSPVGRRSPGHEKSGQPTDEEPPAQADSSALDLPIIGPRAKLIFEKHETTGKMVAQLVDAETGEVIRQIPPEEMLKLAEAIDKYLGLFVDRQS